MSRVEVTYCTLEGHCRECGRWDRAVVAKLAATPRTLADCHPDCDWLTTRAHHPDCELRA